MKHTSIRNIFAFNIFNIRLAFTTLMLIVVIYPIYAQTGAGSIQGTVRDTTGANIPGAGVKMTHLATAQTRETVSNEAGTFLIPSLPTGEYKITVELKGMKTWEGTMLLQVGQSASISPTMEIGAVGDAITVVGDVTQLITTNSPTIGNTLDRTRIEQLPVNQRNVGSLILATTPGVESGGSGFRVGGMRAAAFEIVQDGAVLANRDFGGTVQQLPGMDTIQEIRVETNNSSAKFNRPGTALVTTKSGTNSWHGSLFETHRNNAFGSARKRQDVIQGQEYKTPQLIRNEFGGSVGGPITIPKIYNGANRSFFFVAYEGLERRQGLTGRFSIPTEAMRKGDFSGLVDSLGRKITLYDPLTTKIETRTINGKQYQIAVRDPFPNNQIPLERLSPFAKEMYAKTPLPTTNDNPLVAGNWIGPLPNNESRDMFTTRVDHKFSDNDHIYLRYSKGSNLKLSASTGSATSALATLDQSANMTFVAGVTDSSAFTWTHTFSSTFFSETVLGLTYEKQQVYTGTQPDKLWSDELGLPNPFNQVGFPAITGTGFISYTQTDTTRMHYNITGNIDQNFTWVKGNHQIEFGGRFRQSKLHVLPDQQPPATAVSFGSLATSLLDPTTVPTKTYTPTSLTGHNSANFFLGIAGSYGVRLRRSWYRMREREAGFYFQDSYKATSRLTINGGLRWELHPTLHEKENLFTGYDPVTKTTLNGQSIEALYNMSLTVPSVIANVEKIGVKFDTPSEEKYGVPANFIYSNMFDISPRIGLAYRFFSGKKETIVRGGYGLFVYPPPARNYYANTRFNLPYTAGFNTSLNSSTQSPDKLPNYLLRSIPATIAGLNSADAVDINSPTAITRGSVGITFFDPNFPSTRSHQWNVTFEKELMKDIVLRASYIGQNASKLEQFEALNSAPNAYLWYTRTGKALPTGEYANVATRPFDNQTYGSIERIAKTGWSNTNSFEFEIERRYSKGWGFQAYYTLNNTFSAAGNGWREDYTNPVTSYADGLVPTDFNERNRFINYRRDTEIFKHRVRWNWLVDLPFGKGKSFANTSNRFLNGIIGGWQISGIGTLRSSYVSAPSSAGTYGNFEFYGDKYKIKDCRSGTCYDGYLWYNGYIPAHQINKPNGVMGIPDNYKPAYQPLNPYPADYNPKRDATGPKWCNGKLVWDSIGTNNVCITLTNGAQEVTAYNPGLLPYSKVYWQGPFIWDLDAGMFKSFKIKEGVTLRFNLDFFNVLNRPGMTGPSTSDGIRRYQSSQNDPRTTQATLRLNF